MCASPSICVATLSLMKITLLCHPVPPVLPPAGVVNGRSCIVRSAAGDRKLMISPALCPIHLNELRSYGRPRSYVLPVVTSLRAASREASVISFRLPTSSVAPHTHPHPLPCTHRFMPPFCAATEAEPHRKMTANRATD